MILADTSVWINHLRQADPDLVALLDRGQVLIHPFVFGELALGNLKHRASILGMLGRLPASNTATYDEVLHFIDVQVPAGAGIGYVDAHLLAATRLTPGCTLWTHDHRLCEVATRMNLALP